MAKNVMTIFFSSNVLAIYFRPFSEKPFVSGTKKVEYKCRQWHDTCFHCKVCKTKVISERAKSTELTMKFRMFAVLMTDVDDFVEEQKTIELIFTNTLIILV